MKKVLLIFLSAFVLSCTKEGIKTSNFVEKVNISDWNNDTFNFIGDNCNDSLSEFYKEKESYILVNNNKDTIRSFKEHIKYYLKSRENFLSTLKEKLVSLPDRIDTLVISENYSGIDNLDVSYTLFSNSMNEGKRFYFNSNKFEEIQELDREFKKEGYDRVLTQNAKCNIGHKKLLNSVSFETILYLNSSNEIVYKLKDSYFGHLIID